MDINSNSIYMSPCVELVEITTQAIICQSGSPSGGGTPAGVGSGTEYTFDEGLFG